MNCEKKQTDQRNDSYSNPRANRQEIVRKGRTRETPAGNRIRLCSDDGCPDFFSLLGPCSSKTEPYKGTSVEVRIEKPADTVRTLQLPMDWF